MTSMVPVALSGVLVGVLAAALVFSGASRDLQTILGGGGAVVAVAIAGEELLRLDPTLWWHRRRRKPRRHGTA